MIDIRAARKDPAGWRTALLRKGAADAFDALMAADAEWLALVPQVDEQRSKTKLKGKPTPEQIETLRTVKAELAQLEDKLAQAAARRDDLLAQVPNPPDPTAPDGFTDEDAIEIKRVGKPPGLANPRDHLELAWIDMERGARVAGSRFAYRMGSFALAELALYRYALDIVVAKGFVPVLPPVLVREDAMYGTGFLPTDEVNIYAIERDEMYLTGTSEVGLAALHMSETLDVEELPRRYAGYSTCFRREAGAAGKDTRGMFRVHQFDKVEMFVFCLPERSEDEHELLLAIEEELVQGLGVPYRIVNVAAGDLGASAVEEVRHRGVVPVPAALPRDHLDLEHDGLPGAPPRRALPGRARAPARAHAQRDRGDGARAPRRAGELPGRERRGRDPRGSAALRRAREGRSRSLRPARNRGQVLHTNISASGCRPMLECKT